MTMLDTWWKSLPDPEQKRPWGEYEILLDDDKVKVKRIRVKPNKRLSYQYHHKRSEAWTITEGVGTITLNGETSDYISGQTILIPQGTKHRIENKTNNKIIFIEVQTGSYFGEDDIVRIEDDYNRE